MSNKKLLKKVDKLLCDMRVTNNEMKEREKELNRKHIKEEKIYRFSLGLVSSVLLAGGLIIAIQL